ncbi:MAG: hypothetical protein VX822_01310 [Candidatus Neomarinimicrobiota bacterium]|nr:hypothetical protein [Candidatus Neomarinimicrobiota bacterium]
MKRWLICLLIGTAGISTAAPQKVEDMTVGSLILKSVIMPGLGELSIGERRRAKIFGGIEVGLWLTVVESMAMRKRNRSNMVSYAALHADAKLAGKGHQFAVDVANYMSSDEFNEEHQRMRLPSRIYSIEGYEWAWKSDEHREKYWRYLRSRATAQKIGLFAAGGMVLNRIVSAIDVSYLARLQDSGVSLHVLPLRNQGSQLVLSVSF